MPQVIGTVNGLIENLQLQDRVARMLKSFRHKYALPDSLKPLQQKVLTPCCGNITLMEIEERGARQ